jgi:hypothetical protein
MRAHSIRLVGFAYVAVLAFSLFLLFRNLDRKLLWGDEAETALLAKNVLRFGIPKTVDGLNHITVLGDFRDENPVHVWTWAPWLQDYVTAAAFFTFGESTWSSRAPFAAIGWTSVALLAFIGFRIYRSHLVALTSAILLTTSEIFLLHARQCRYYAITVLAEIVLVYGAYALLNGRKCAAWLLVPALILQFYTNYILIVANAPLLLCLGWISRKQADLVKRLALAAIIVAAAALPWLLYARPWRQAQELAHEKLFEKNLYYISEWHFHFIPWVFFLLPLMSLLTSRRPPEPGNIPKFEAALIVLLVGYFVVLLPAQSELRYLLPLLPIGCLLSSAWLARYIDSKAVIGLIVTIQAATNFIPIVTTFGLNREHRWRAPIVEFITSLNADYVDRFSDVLQFFRANAAPGQQVWVRDPEFPLIFYTGLRVIDARLNQPREMPDWILPQSASGLIEQESLEIPDSIKSNYVPVFLTVHDSDRLANVPEPDVYQYRTTQKVAPFVIYRRTQR